MKKNNKGFTLIELLAVIVVLAIIMVIATQQINKTISRTRANSMISTLKMAANGVKTKQADGSMEACSSGKCLEDVVDYDTDDYTISVTGDSSAWKITVTATSGGEFERADFSLVDSATDNSDIGKTHVDIAKVNGDKMPTISCYVDSNGNITATKPTTE